MNLFRKSRPQKLFEDVWSESFGLTHLIWEMTLAFHSSNSEQTKTNLLNFLEGKSEEMLQIQGRLSEIRKETANILYKNCPEPHKEEWYSFVTEIHSFQDRLISNLIRLFLLKSILLQIDKTHPKKKELAIILENSFQNLAKAKEMTDKITTETDKSYQAVFDAISIATSIDENINFDEAYKIERSRWE